MGPAFYDPDRWRAARAVGRTCRGLLRQGLWRGLPRPPRTPQPGGRRRSIASALRPCSCWPRFVSSPCVIAGLFIDLLAPVVQSLVGGRMPVQTFLPWASIVPIADVRSSYNGLLILLFLAISRTLAAMFIHRYATRAIGVVISGIAAIPIRPPPRNIPVRASPCRSAACSAPRCPGARTGGYAASG